MTTSTADRLFTTRQAGGRTLYKLYFIVFVAGILSLFYYRLTHIPTSGTSTPHHIHILLWILISLAEFWFSATWIFQQGFRWAPTFHTTYPDRLTPSDLPSIDVLVCTADPDREPPEIVANTLLSLMAYDYYDDDVNKSKLAYYLSDDGGSELTFNAVYQASIFAKVWLPFCRKYNVESRAPRDYFSTMKDSTLDDDGGQRFRQEYQRVKEKFDEMQQRIKRARRLGRVEEEIRKAHKGFRAWDSKVDRRDHPTILEVLLRGNGEDKDAEGNPMPTLVYISREKRPTHPHNYKAGAMNAMIRVSAVMSNAPLVLNVDCDMHSNNSKALRHAVCFFLDPKEGHRIGYVQFPQSFGGITKNDLYANGVKRIYEIEFFGKNAYNGPAYAGTGSVHRRESLNGRKFDPNFQLKLEDNSVGRITNWEELEEKAKAVTSCGYETGKWGKEMGLMYGCTTEDIFTGLVLQSRGWSSVYCSPEERKAYLGLAPVNTNDTLIQHKRWSTGLLQVFLSDYCPWTHGVGRLKLGLIMCYSFYTLWALWCLPMLIYALVPPLAMLHGISLFPKVWDPWFKVFAFLGIASHLFSLGELMWAKGTIKMWWNETRMWMMKGTSSYLFTIMVVTLKKLGISDEVGFEITSKVTDEEAMKRYKQEIMEFSVSSPMFLPPTTLSLLNLYCFLSTITVVVKVGLSGLDHILLQFIISGYISLISLPLYEAMFLRKDKGRMPFNVTMCSLGLAFTILCLSSLFLM